MSALHAPELWAVEECHVPITLWPWFPPLQLPAAVVEGMTAAELEECTDAARHEVVRLLRLRAGGPLNGGGR